MTDMVIKQNGKSRYMKADVIDQDISTYAKFLALLTSGEFTFDLNGLNQDGIEVDGTMLNKTNLLKDSTATALGGDGNTTVDGAFQLVESKKGDKSVGNAVTIETTDWQGSSAPYTVTKSVTGVTTTNNIIVTFAPASFQTWISCEIRATAQGTGTVTISATYKPSVQVTAQVLVLG